MVFSLINYQPSTPEQQSPFGNLLTGALQKYDAMTRSQYLQPTLAEELKKSQLYNKWYEPNIKSEIGLRGAQAGHLGSLTQGQNITNEFLPQSLQSIIDFRKQNILKQEILNRFLPGLKAEELKKDQLYNELYKPNIQSEIGLRTTQGGHLGAETTALNISNPYLRQKLIDEEKSRNLKAIQTEIFNNMLKQRLQNTGNINMPTNMPHNMPTNIENIPENISEQYHPGQGQPLFAGDNQENMQTQPEINNIPNQEQQNFYQQPQLTNDDIINKKFFGIDTFTPRQKSYSDYINKISIAKQTEKTKIEAKEAYDDYKQTIAAQTDLPALRNSLKAAMRMKDIILNRPAFWGHNWFPERFAKTATDELVGEFQSELIPQLANMEQTLSEKGNQLALKISASKLPGFESTQQVNLGKINGLIDNIQKRIKVTKDIAGGNIRRIGTKRFKQVNGKWHQLERGEF